MASTEKTAKESKTKAILCRCCDEQFEPYSVYIKDCPRCLTICVKVAQQSFKAEELYPDLEFIVTYRVTKTQYSLSSPLLEGDSLIPSEIKRIYSVPRLFKKCHMTGTQVDLHCQPLKYFNLGASDCEMGHYYKLRVTTQYTIISAEIRKKVDLGLDD